jgi:carbon monoxide dehydrogenase subunit G
MDDGVVNIPSSSAISSDAPSPFGGALGHRPLVEVELDRDGYPASATAAIRLGRPRDDVWALLGEVERFTRHIPMIRRAHRDGDRITLELRFKVAVFSAKFAVTARLTEEEGRVVDIAWLSGEPRDLRMRFELYDADEGRATLLVLRFAFDVLSLGWLVSFFLKHHPEIRFGVLAGSALTLLEAIQRAVATAPVK